LPVVTIVPAAKGCFVTECNGPGKNETHYLKKGYGNIRRSGRRSFWLIFKRRHSRYKR
jgi:hypothetical protein